MEEMYDKRIWINRTIELLEKNQDKINWDLLSRNPNAISILEKNPDKINWEELSANQGTYEINYKFMKERMDIIREDLMKAVYHPKRLQYWLNLGYDIFDQ